MGTAGAHNGTWGVFTDVVYLKFQASESASRDFTIGNVGPARRCQRGLRLGA